MKFYYVIRYAGTNKIEHNKQIHSFKTLLKSYKSIYKKFKKGNIFCFYIERWVLAPNEDMYVDTLRSYHGNRKKSDYFFGNKKYKEVE